MRLKESKDEVLRRMQGKAEDHRTPHDRKVCGCFDSAYAERLVIFRKGLLWLGRSGEVSDKAMEVLNAHEEETNRKWCEESLEGFKDYWRSVCREAS